MNLKIGFDEEMIKNPSIVDEMYNVSFLLKYSSFCFANNGIISVFKYYHFSLSWKISNFSTTT